MASNSFGKVINMSAEGFFNYDKTFNKIHHVSAVLGAGWYKTQTHGFGLTAAGFFTDALKYNNVGIANEKDKESVRSWKTERTKALTVYARQLFPSGQVCPDLHAPS